MATIRVQWKEELLWEDAAGTLQFEFPMGIPTVYFPTRERWTKLAPAFAQGRYDEVRADVEAWCERDGVPIVCDDTAGVREVE